MASPRRILEERGLSPQKGLGQNFLTDPSVIRTILAKAALPADAPVLEIGPGLGALTRPLLEAGYQVTAIEFDRGLAGYLQDELVPRFPDRFRLINMDALKVDLPALFPDRSFSAIGNLPYVISTPLLFKLLDCRNQVLKAVLMFQKELADRIAAGPGSHAYGRLSVMMGYFAVTGRIMALGPEAFYPRPKVSSTVLEVKFKPSPRPLLENPKLFSGIVAAGFSRRRKTLQNALRSTFSQDQVDRALDRAGIDPVRRAETLTVEEFVQLTNAMAFTDDSV